MILSVQMGARIVYCGWKIAFAGAVAILELPPLLSCNGQDARWPHRQDACATESRVSASECRSIKMGFADKFPMRVAPAGAFPFSFKRRTMNEKIGASSPSASRFSCFVQT